MGWTGYYDLSRKQAVEHELRGYEIRAAGWVNNVYYAAVEIKPGEVMGLVLLTRKEKGELLVKTMSEDMGPYYYDAPVKVLKALSPTEHANSLAWRARCWDQRAKIRITEKMRSGDKVRFKSPIKFSNGESLQEFTYSKDGRRTVFRDRFGAPYIITNWRRREFEVVGTRFA